MMQRFWLKMGGCCGLVLFVCALLSGCHLMPRACDRGAVSARVDQRTGFTLSAPCAPGEVVLPNGASLDDGLTEEEAVFIALWNNAAFQEQLADLGIAHGDLIQAGLLPNPELIYFWPVNDKPFKYAFEFPLEAFWLRPIRIRAAARESARVCDRLTQLALDLIRDVRQAYADVLLAKGRQRVAEEGVRVRGGIAKLAEKRFKDGDISQQEAATAKIDSHLAEQEATRIAFDVTLTEERLRNLLGTGSDRRPLTLIDGPLPTALPLDLDALTEEATQTRPDALAAAEAALAARERLRLSRLIWFRVLGIGDASSGRVTGHDFGPAIRATVPLFNWNQGNVARAEAELERAKRAQQTIHNQIILEVRQSHARYVQSQTELGILNNKVRPEVETAIRRAELAYREGNTAYVVVLETTRQQIDTLLRQQQLHSEIRRAWADLERSVGHRLDSAPCAPAPEKVSHD